MKKALFLSCMIFLIIGTVSAVDWPFGKTAYCNFLNLTNGTDCNVSWCGQVVNNASQSCGWSQAEELCRCTISVQNNVTVYVNVTNNTIPAGYYNSSQLEEVIRNVTNFNRQYSENLTMQLRDSVADRIENLTVTGNTIYNPQVQESSLPWWILPLTALIFVVGIVYSQSKKSKEARLPPHKEAIRESYRNKKPSEKHSVMKRVINFPQSLKKDEPRENPSEES